MADIPMFPRGFVTHEHPFQLEPKVQQYVKEVFWPHSKASIAEYASYFKYFQWAISVLAWPDGINYEMQFCMKTYQDLVKITRYMELHPDFDRSKMAEELECEFPDADPGQILRSLDLTARLWLNLHVRSQDFPLGPSLSDMTEIDWLEKGSLNKLVEDCFQPSSYSINEQNKAIDPAFTIKNLRRFCRINVQWTANLRDHLLYDRSTATLHLFPHKICLISHLDSWNVLPKDFVAETLRTLDLLFPFGEEDTRKYLDQTGQTFYRTSSRDLSRATNFGEFRYWHKRLIELHGVFNQAPRSILQLWYDRRNPLQWWTFWLAALIAVLTVVFGIISSYTGFQQLAIAEQAYQLSVWQICSQPNPPTAYCKT
ncbi:hypothetical protein JMJ35_009991 [Cladonia borealis]|uniref:Uncharacterized protein n=1 Tax=Cladonia borealis TaxID=184061 RepID=A0AA39QQU7_9LECA|nr:hypothetical protein JMJ35_009991 [Cladonia borealis]